MRRFRLNTALLALVAVSVACGSGDETAAVPSLEPGGTTTGAVEIDGTMVEYAVSVPADFTIGDEAPLLLAFPPGGQDLGQARSFVANTYSSEASRLGWVVVSPAAPDGELFFQGSEELIPGFLDWTESWVSPEGGAPHVIGISNGGISAFRYAAQNPDRILSMIAFPGFPRSEDDKASLEALVDIPIRLYVGGIDIDWVLPAEEAAASLTDLGGDVELTIADGEGHFMRSLADGVVLFDALESFR